MSALVDSPGMIPLRVTRAEPAANRIQLFEFKHPKGELLPEFSPGAHILLRVPNGATRKYSLCNDPIERDHYVIAVKRDATGQGGSVSMVDRVRTGDEIRVAPPRNDFALKENRAGYIFIAGGIGITPILSMVRHLHSTGGARFRLYYLSRSPETTAFLDELSGPQFRGQVKIHHDFGDPAKSLDLWPILEQAKGAHLYCCGPRSLMQAVRDMTGHWSSAAVHFESFVDGASTHKADDRAFKVRLARSGDVVTVPADLSIMDAVRRHGHQVPSSCESGTCGTCKTKLISGDVDHRDLVLSDAERADHIMLCVSRARSGDIVIDL